jgi:hypothetical protein
MQNGQLLRLHAEEFEGKELYVVFFIRDAGTGVSDS